MSAAARGICSCEGVGKVKAVEVRTLWLQQVIKAMTFTLKTVKSHDNCADFGTKTLIAATLTLLRYLNSLADKKEMDDVCRAMRATITSIGEPRKQGILALRVLEQTMDEIARNGHTISGDEKLLRGLERKLEPKLEPEQLYATRANSLQDWSKRKSS